MRTEMRDGSRRSLPMRALLALLLFLGVLVSMPSGSPAAQAATNAYMRNFGGWEVGAFLSSTGYIVYCVEPGAIEPSGEQLAPSVATVLEGYSASPFDGTGWSGPVASGAVSGEALSRMNWLLTTYGQTTDPDTAAVVQLALWILRGDPGAANWLHHHLVWVLNHGGEWHVERAYELAAEAESVTLASNGQASEARLELATGAEHGSGSVRYPEGTTALSIEGGGFGNGSKKLVLPEGTAGLAEWRASLHEDGWSRFATISVSAEWEKSSTSWPAALTVHPSASGDQQNLGAMVGPAVETSRSTLGPERIRIDSQFSPALTTRSASEFVERGSGRFADRVTLGVAEGSAPWAVRTGKTGSVQYAPILAEGTLYGPYSQPQETAAAVPRGAPVAARAQLLADHGPGEYLVSAEEEPKESGYYYWVWRVRASAQSSEVQSSELIPEDYEFSDRFGLAEEGQVVASRLRWRTALDERELPLDGLVLRDRLDVSLHGGAWLRDAEGKRIPARIRLTVYRTDAEPTRRQSVPTDAHEVARSFMTVGETGRDLAADPIELPFETRGWVTVQACLLAEDQAEEYRGAIEEWCDDFGVPAESARVVVPTVRTEAVPSVEIGDAFHDTAIVEGLVPHGSTIGFTYYLRPEVGDPKYDENWKPVEDGRGQVVRWKGEEIEALTEEERCLAQPVASTARVGVEGAGTTRSPSVAARTAGVGYWVEDLDMPHPDTGERFELHRGACGLENERTVIVDTPVSESQSEPEPGLAHTGVDLHPLLAAAGALPLAGICVLTLAGRRRRRAGDGSAAALRRVQN